MITNGVENFVFQFESGRFGFASGPEVDELRSLGIKMDWGGGFSSCSQFLNSVGYGPDVAQVFAYSGGVTFHGNHEKSRDFFLLNIVAKYCRVGRYV